MVDGSKNANYGIVIMNQYMNLIESEFKKYKEQPELLLELLHSSDNIITWLFSKDSEMIEPYSYASEIDGHDRGIYSKKNFLSFEEASNNNFFIYGFHKEKGVVKIISTSHQFGTIISFYLYENELIKIISAQFKDGFLEKEHISLSIPKLMGIKYVFRNENDLTILNKGIVRKNISITKIIYNNELPIKLISDEGIEYDFCFDNGLLTEITHKDSGFYIYKAKNH